MHVRVNVSGIDEQAIPPFWAFFILEPRNPVCVPGPHSGREEDAFAHKDHVNS